MKPSVISAEALFEEHRTALHWEWIAGHAHPERRFDAAAVRNAQSAADLVGYLNLIHPNRIHVFGNAEMAYTRRVGAARSAALDEDLVAGHPPAIIVADGLTPPADLLERASADGLPVLGTPLPAARVPAFAPCACAQSSITGMPCRAASAPIATRSAHCP